jgi:hypothetical protein
MILLSPWFPTRLPSRAPEKGKWSILPRTVKQILQGFCSPLFSHFLVRGEIFFGRGGQPWAWFLSGIQNPAREIVGQPASAGRPTVLPDAASPQKISLAPPRTSGGPGVQVEQRADHGQIVDTPPPPPEELEQMEPRQPPLPPGPSGGGDGLHQAPRIAIQPIMAKV